jgi:hypothetical protein
MARCKTTGRKAGSRDSITMTRNELATMVKWMNDIALRCPNKPQANDMVTFELSFRRHFYYCMNLSDLIPADPNTRGELLNIETLDQHVTIKLVYCKTLDDLNFPEMDRKRKISILNVLRNNNTQNSQVTITALKEGLEWFEKHPFICSNVMPDTISNLQSQSHPVDGTYVRETYERIGFSVGDLCDWSSELSLKGLETKKTSSESVVFALHFFDRIIDSSFYSKDINDFYPSEDLRKKLISGIKPSGFNTKMYLCLGDEDNYDGDSDYFGGYFVHERENMSLSEFLTNSEGQNRAGSDSILSTITNQLTNHRDKVTPIIQKITHVIKRMIDCHKLIVDLGNHDKASGFEFIIGVSNPIDIRGNNNNNARVFEIIIGVPNQTDTRDRPTKHSDDVKRKKH